MCRAVVRRRLPERAVHGARGGVLRVLQAVRMRVRVGVRVRRVAVRDARLRRVARAQVARAAMVLRQRERRARRPPVPPLLHVRAGRASRRAAARAAPRARQRMPPRLVRAPVVSLPPRHPFRSSLPLLASPPHRRPATSHPLINHQNNTSHAPVTITLYNRNLLFTSPFRTLVITRLHHLVPLKSVSTSSNSLAI